MSPMKWSSRTRSSLLALVLVVGVAATSCTGKQTVLTDSRHARGGSETAATSTPNPPSTSASPTARGPGSKPTSGREPAPAPTRAPTTPEPPADERPLTLAFAGDIQFERQLSPLLEDPASALAPIRPQLGAADLTIANLETAVTTRGEAEDKTYTFRAPASAFDAVAAAGIDVVSMANNHGVDFGPEGLADTLAAADDAPLAVVGIGGDADEAFAPYVTDVRGTSVAVIGATAFDDPTARNYPAGEDRAGIAVALDPERLVRTVRRARPTNDVVVVYLHWGIERVPCPTIGQRRLAMALVDAGADIVIGSHAHVLLGAGQLGGAYVGYGLGNFVWPNRRSVAETTTGVLTLTMDGRRVSRTAWSPARVGADGLPHFATGERAQRMRQDFDRLRSCTNLTRSATR